MDFAADPAVATMVSPEASFRPPPGPHFHIESVLRRRPRYMDFAADPAVATRASQEAKIPSRASSSQNGFRGGPSRGDEGLPRGQNSPQGVVLPMWISLRIQPWRRGPPKRPKGRSPRGLVRPPCEGGRCERRARTACRGKQRRRGGPVVVVVPSPHLLLSSSFSLVYFPR